MPEPTSIILLGGGLLGALIRLAKRSFEEAKRIMDIVLSILFLFILSPAVLIIALLVKVTSPGPVLVKQTRVGKGGKLFTMYNFRSIQNDISGIENDPKITCIGHFLRQTHLDEVPQFINVIKGEMSIIGPRPETPNFVDEHSRELPEYQQLLSIRPGITGLAQVSDQHDESKDAIRRKLQYDLQYIKGVQDKCWGNEFRILFHTIVLLITGKIIR